MSAAAGKAKCEHPQWTVEKTALGKRAMCVECGEQWLVKPSLIDKLTGQVVTPKNVMNGHVKLECRHTCMSYVKPDGDKGTKCGTCDEWLSGLGLHDYITARTKAPAPSYYMKRTSKTVGPKGQPHWVHDKWDSVAVHSFYDAEMQIRQWNVRAELDGVDIQYQLPLYCRRCFKSELNETFAGHVCSECKGKPMVCSHCGVYTSKPQHFNGSNALCGECYANRVNFALKNAKAKGVDMTPFKPAAPKPVAVKRQNGDFWPLPKNAAPVGATQWAYQGSGKTPYVITQYATKRDGAVTVDGWACSCPNFTRNTPRDHCKHIIKVMVSEGITPGLINKAHAKTLQVVVGASDAQLEAFQKWQKEQAENKPKSGNVVLNDDIMASGRKFR